MSASEQKPREEDKGLKPMNKAEINDACNKRLQNSIEQYQNNNSEPP